MIEERGFATEALRVRLARCPVMWSGERSASPWSGTVRRTRCVRGVRLRPPGPPVARVGPPFVQLVQRRFAAASLRAMAAAHRSTSHLRKRVLHPIREPLHFIVIAVMSVMRRVLFPNLLLWVFYMVVNAWRVRTVRPSSR